MPSAVLSPQKLPALLHLAASSSVALSRGRHRPPRVRYSRALFPSPLYLWHSVLTYIYLCLLRPEAGSSSGHSVVGTLVGQAPRPGPGECSAKEATLSGPQRKAPSAPVTSLALCYVVSSAFSGLYHCLLSRGLLPCYTVGNLRVRTGLSFILESTMFSSIPSFRVPERRSS